MTRYNSKRLEVICAKAILIDYDKQNKRKPTTEKMWELAFILKEQKLKEAKKYLDNNRSQFHNELFNPYSIFYYKDQRLFLENDKVKKYIPLMIDIFKNETSINELNLLTEEHTKGKYKTFNKYYYSAYLNMREKIASKIAIDTLIKEIQNNLPQ